MTSVQLNYIIALTCTVSLVTLGECDVKLCNGRYGKERYESVTQCPAGLLIMDGGAEVTTSKKLQGERKFCYVEDLCRNMADEPLCEPHAGGALKAQYIMGNVTVNQNFQVFDNEELDACNLEKLNQVDRQRRRATTIGETQVISKYPASPQLIEETRQMFLYLSGLDPVDAPADLESSKLLQDVLHVMHKRCDPSRLEPMFLKSIYRAFLWLLNKYRSSDLLDIPVDMATKVRKALSKCAHNPHAIHVSGTECLSKITYVSLKVGDNGIEAAADYHQEDKFSFKWGLYDPVVDAVWLSIDTVHTLCSKYLEANGVLHEFSTYMMKLLNLERMKERWRTPTPLKRQEIYDHLLLAPVNQSMAILDACNFAGTIASPFGRSIRPLVRISPNAREKRNAPGQNPSVVCLRSTAEKASEVKTLQRSMCSNVGNNKSE